MDLEEACRGRGVWVGRYRRSVLRLLAGEQRHASVEEIHRAIQREHPRMRLATVYRTVKVLEEAGVLVRLDFGDGLARYEAAGDSRHDHLINRDTGTVIEFQDERLGALLGRIAQGLGYRLAGYRLNLYGAAQPDAVPDTETTPHRNGALLPLRGASRRTPEASDGCAGWDEGYPPQAEGFAPPHPNPSPARGEGLRAMAPPHP